MKEAEQKSVVLKLTGAIALDGQIARAGSLVEMSDSEAKDLMRRGKAVLATEHDASQHGPTVAEFVAAGYQATDYPPYGYASRSTEEEIQAAITAQAASTGGADTGATVGDDAGSDTSAPAVDAAAANPAAETEKPAAAARNARRAS